MPPQRWLVLSVPIPEGAPADLLPDALIELGGTGVEEHEGRFLTYLPPPPDLDDFLAVARHRLGGLPGIEDPDLEWRWQPHEAWEEIWKRGLRPRKISERLWVSPSWCAPDTEPGEILVVMDPGMAFGTAEHPTTRSCLRLLDAAVRPGDRVADVGAGSGILSISAALLGAEEVVAFEMDPMSCEVVEENAKSNGVESVIQVIPGQVEGGQNLTGSPFHGILANLQRSTLLPIFGDLSRSLVPGGWLIVSGVLLEEEKETRLGAEAAGFTLVREDIEGGWWSAVLRVADDPDEDTAR